MNYSRRLQSVSVLTRKITKPACHAKSGDWSRPKKLFPFPGSIPNNRFAYLVQKLQIWRVRILSFVTVRVFDPMSRALYRKTWNCILYGQKESKAFGYQSSKVFPNFLLSLSLMQLSCTEISEHVDRCSSMAIWMAALLVMNTSWLKSVIRLSSYYHKLL